MSGLDRYRLLGRSGLRVSPLALGTMTFGTEWGWGSEEDEARSIFNAYVEAGGNFIDTANFYTGGTSESLLGKFIKGKRDELVLATKYALNMRSGDPNAGGNHRKSMVQSLEGSLQRLGTDYVDVLWIHSWDGITPIEEIMRGLDDIVRAGKALYIGVSNPPAWAAARANTIAEFRGWTSFIGMQVQYSLIERAVERDILPMSRELGIGLTPWSPLGGGLLTGKYARSDDGSKDALDESLRKESNAGRIDDRNLTIVKEVAAIAKELKCGPAQVAIRWLMDRAGVSSVIMGARTLAQLQDNLGVASVELTDDQTTRLDRVSKIELGYPHDFLSSGSVRKYITGGTHIERS